MAFIQPDVETQHCHCPCCGKQLIVVYHINGDSLGPEVVHLNEDNTYDPVCADVSAIWPEGG